MFFIFQLLSPPLEYHPTGPCYGMEARSTRGGQEGRIILCNVDEAGSSATALGPS